MSTDKEIYKGVEVLRKYLNESPLKSEYHGQSGYAIVKEILEAVDNEEMEEMAKDLERDKRKEELWKRVEDAEELIGYAIKTGQLDPEDMEDWTDEDKLDYANKAEVKENEKND